MKVPTHHPALRARLTGCLEPLALALDFDRAAPGTRRGDHDLSPGWRAPPPLKPAAVLVPIVDREEGLTVLLTTRTAHLAQHAGQVSFPGGRVEEQDSSPLETALRETREEVGISEELIEPAGLLSHYETVTGFLVTPIVAFVSAAAEPRIDPTEVEDAFEIALSSVLDEDGFREGFGTFRGESRSYYVLANPHRFIWGATAGMLRDLLRRYRSAEGVDFSK